MTHPPYFSIIQFSGGKQKMSISPRRKQSPDLSKTRTNSDRTMILLGIFLVLFFITAGYFSYVQTGSETIPKERGPVKDPKNLPKGESTGKLDLPFPETIKMVTYQPNCNLREKTLQTGLRVKSTPLPEGFLSES
jgi:hypothetical protein